MPYENCLAVPELVCVFEFSQNRDWCNGHCVEWLTNSRGSFQVNKWLGDSCAGKAYKRTRSTVGSGVKYKPADLTGEAAKRIANYQSCCLSNDAKAWSFLGVQMHSISEEDVRGGMVAEASLAATVLDFSPALIGWNYDTSGLNLMARSDAERRDTLKGRQHQTALNVLEGNAGDSVVSFFDPNVAHFVVKEKDFAKFLAAYLADIRAIEEAKVSSSFDLVTISGVRRGIG